MDILFVIFVSHRWVIVMSAVTRPGFIDRSGSAFNGSLNSPINRQPPATAEVGAAMACAGNVLSRRRGSIAIAIKPPGHSERFVQGGMAKSEGAPLGRLPAIEAAPRNGS
jgi:hypothetical protein